PGEGLGGRQVGQRDPAGRIGRPGERDVRVEAVVRGADLRPARGHLVVAIFGQLVPPRGVLQRVGHQPADRVTGRVDVPEPAAAERLDRVEHTALELDPVRRLAVVQFGRAVRVVPVTETFGDHYRAGLGRPLDGLQHVGDLVLAHGEHEYRDV